MFNRVRRHRPARNIIKMLPPAKGVLTEKVIDSKLRERKASVLWPINFDVKADCTNIGDKSALSRFLFKEEYGASAEEASPG